MLVTEEITAYDFIERCWSGARDTIADLTVDEVKTVLDILEETAYEPMSLTEVNDFFWFERDTIAEWLGYEDYEEIMYREMEED